MRKLFYVIILIAAVKLKKSAMPSKVSDVLTAFSVGRSNAFSIFVPLHLTSPPFNTEKTKLNQHLALRAFSRSLLGKTGCYCSWTRA